MACLMAGFSSSQPLSTPLSKPPLGIIPNFTHPESASKRLYITAGICLPLVFLFVGFRLYSKLFIMKKRSMDDFACVIAFIGTCIWVSLAIAEVSGEAYGRHAWDVTLGQLTPSQLKLSLFIEILYSPVVYFIKLTLFLFFLEIFSSVRWMNILIYLSIGLSGLFYLSTSIATAVFCSPTRNESWLTSLDSSKTRQATTVGLVTCAMGIFSDFYILLLPLPLLWRLQLPTRRKIAVFMVFLTGLLACICSILRMIYLVALSESNDNTWSVVPLYMVFIVEMTAGMIVLCTPSATAVTKLVYTNAVSIWKTRLTASEDYQMEGLKGGTDRRSSKRYTKMNTLHDGIIPEVV